MTHRPQLPAPLPLPHRHPEMRWQTRRSGREGQVSASATPTYAPARSPPRQSPVGSLQAHPRGPCLPGPGWLRPACPPQGGRPVWGPKPPAGPRSGWHPGLTRSSPRGSRRGRESGTRGRARCFCPAAAFPRRPWPSGSRSEVPPQGSGQSSWPLSTAPLPTPSPHASCEMPAPTFRLYSPQNKPETFPECPSFLWGLGGRQGERASPYQPSLWAIMASNLTSGPALRASPALGSCLRSGQAWGLQ